MLIRECAEQHEKSFLAENASKSAETRGRIIYEKPCDIRIEYQETTLAQIIRLVDEATSSKAPIAKMADKVSGIFVPVVISIAILAAVLWLFAGKSFEFALTIAIAVLVI